MTQAQEDKLNALLKQYETEQREFENHVLWKELNTTPKEFFKKVQESMAKSGIATEVWQQKLAEAKQALETRVREKRNQYQKFNFNQLRGIKA